MIRIVPYIDRKGQDTGSYEIDIRIRWPDGTTYRERVRSPVKSFKDAQVWAARRESHLLREGPASVKAPAPEVPTVREFFPGFVSKHYKAEQLKESTAWSAEKHARTWLFPLLGDKRLNEVTQSDVQDLKSALSGSAPKTVNNVLSTLNVLLKKAKKWGIISEVPVTIELLKVDNARELYFYDQETYERLVQGARSRHHRYYLTVLLAGDAGLRLGELCALTWSQVDQTGKRVIIDRAVWQGVVDAPKGGRTRRVPLTPRLSAALQAQRADTAVVGAPDGGLVLLSARGAALSERTVRNWMEISERHAGLPVTGRVHILRHTFCSHLAQEGAPARAIQQLAGHTDLHTTMRYMHLAPGHLDAAIALLGRGDAPAPVEFGIRGPRGGIREAKSGRQKKSTKTDG